MSFIKRMLFAIFLLGVSLSNVFALENIGRDGLGQTIQINMNVKGITNKTSWLITTRDVDNN